MILPALVLVALAAPVGAQTVEAVLDQAKADCASIDNGVFAAPANAVVQIDLTGDGVLASVVDSALFQCTTSASYWGGTGGTGLSVIIAGQQFDLMAQSWQVLPTQGLPVLLLWHNGGACGGSGADVCAEALVWSDYQQKLMTVAP